ncbi:MAG: MarR family transcriptional regulator [Burkholderiales bacterium]|jgi:predicted transcriptional regulator|nr:MarR family transcriptional regulator [Burkholderiales bacterium]
MKTLKVGIMSYENYKKRVLAIASGKYKPSPTEPKIWFESLRSLAEVLNENNTRLLSIIEKSKPASIKELAELSGRKSSNLSRTLKTFERYGIIELKKENKFIRPIARAIDFDIKYHCA